MLADERTPGTRIIQRHALAHILFEVSNPAMIRNERKINEKEKLIKSPKIVHFMELIEIIFTLWRVDWW